MNINYFGKDLPHGILKNIITENNFNPQFTLQKKIYYNFLRSIIPIQLRQKIQERVNSKIILKKNFITEELTDLLLNDVDVNLIINNLKYKDDKKGVIVITHDVEEQIGFNFIPKIIELEGKYGLKSSWNIVPYKYKIDAGIIKLIRDSGNEIGIHGYNHDGKLYYSEKIFNERVPLINEALKKYDSVGFRSPMVHRNLKWLQKLNIEYDSSCFDYDPFQPFPGGTGSIWPFIAGKFIELPYTLPQDHTMFFVLKQKDISIWEKKIDWILCSKGVVLALTHPDYLIDTNHYQMYEELLKYLCRFENSWFCLPKDLAMWWRNKSDFST